MIKRENYNVKLMTQGILRAMERLQSGNWFEVNIKQGFLPSHAAFYRALRLCVEYGWMEEGPAIQSGGKYVAYRMTPQGFAVYDRARLRESSLKWRGSNVYERDTAVLSHSSSSNGKQSIATTTARMVIVSPSMGRNRSG